MPAKRVPKKRIKALDQFCKNVAFIIEQAQPFDVKDNGEFGKSWNIQTRAGKLYIHIPAPQPGGSQFPMIFCRFDEPDKAAPIISELGQTFNKFSGKWNWHWWGELSERIVADPYLLMDFANSLSTFHNGDKLSLKLPEQS